MAIKICLSEIVWLLLVFWARVDGVIVDHKKKITRDYEAIDDLSFNCFVIDDEINAVLDRDLSKLLSWLNWIYKY